MKRTVIALMSAFLLVVPATSIAGEDVIAHYFEIESMVNDMMVKGPMKMKEQVNEAKKNGLMVFNVKEHCQLTVQTLATYSRGQISKEEAKYEIVKSLSADGAGGLQFALSEGKYFAPSHISIIIVEVNITNPRTHEDLIEVLDVAENFAIQNKNRKKKQP